MSPPRSSQSDGATTNSDDGGSPIVDVTMVTPPSSPVNSGNQTDEGDCDSRPPHSYVRLVIMALLARPGMQATIKEIYEQITCTFPYYQENRLHWKNSVRHNLTVFKCFERVSSANRGSHLWRLTGDWQSILDKAETIQPRKRPSSVKTGDKRAEKAKKSSKSRHESKRGSSKENNNSKHKKRGKKSKVRSKVNGRSPFTVFNFTTPNESTRAARSTRMPTPPPKLPGIDNVFLPSPTPSITPPNCKADIWARSPDFNLNNLPELSFEEVTEVLCDATQNLSSQFVAEVSPKPILDGFEWIDRPIWHLYTPSPSPPAPSHPDRLTPTGCTPPSSKTNLWELVEPEVDGMMGLLTMMDSDWSKSSADENYLTRL